MRVMAAVPADHPLTIAWGIYKQTPEFVNTRKWALEAGKLAENSHYVDGSLWAAFEMGWRIALAAAPASATEPAPLDAFKTIEAESNQLRELCTKHRNEAAELRSALHDLLTWFPDKPSPPEWRLRGGEQGADEAVQYARDLIGVTNDT